MKKNYIIHSNVTIGENCIIEDFVEIGKTGKYSKKNTATKIGDNCILRSGTIIYAGVTAKNGLQTGHNTLIREGNALGENVVIGSGTELGLRNIIGDNSRIHSWCFLEDVKIGKNVFVGPHVTFTNDPHPLCSRYIGCFKGADVEDEAIIGGGTTILPHIKIGRRALIGAGSVVTKDVAEFSVAVGNPARKIKTIDEIICNKSGTPHKPYSTSGVE